MENINWKGGARTALVAAAVVAVNTAEAEQRTHTWSTDATIAKQELDAFIAEIKAAYPADDVIKAKDKIARAKDIGDITSENIIAGQKANLEPPQTHTTVLPACLQPKEKEKGTVFYIADKRYEIVMNPPRQQHTKV